MEGVATRCRLHIPAQPDLADSGVENVSFILEQSFPKFALWISYFQIPIMRYWIITVETKTRVKE